MDFNPNIFYANIIYYNQLQWNFWEIKHEIYNDFQSYLFSCLVQLLRITFHKILHFTWKLIYFFVSTFSIHLSLHSDMCSVR